MSVSYEPDTAGATAATSTDPTGAATDAQANAIDLAVEQAGGRPGSIDWTNSIVDMPMDRGPSASTTSRDRQA